MEKIGKNFELQTEPEKGNLEIERKFLIKRLPENLEEIAQEKVRIRQGYVSISKEGAEKRIREKKTD